LLVAQCSSVDADWFTSRCGARPRRKAAALLAGGAPWIAGCAQRGLDVGRERVLRHLIILRGQRARQTVSVGSHEITQLLHEYGCVTVFTVVALQAVGCPLPGTTALVAAALYASTANGLPIGGVIAAGALGALCGTMAGFALGRRGGEPLLHAIGRRLRQSPERVQRVRRELAASGAGWLFVARFVPGLRNVSGLVAGASGMPLARFLPIRAAAALTWALVNGLEYYFFGRALASASTWLQVLLVVASIAWLVISLGVLRTPALRRLRAQSDVSSTSST
jgi:membrane protein DedA with SNARE-associated domain